MPRDVLQELHKAAVSPPAGFKISGAEVTKP